jgi:DNA-directed RNA polymerase
MPELWNLLKPEVQESRKNYQALLEEEMLNLSNNRYWEEYNRSPDEGYPEQGLLDSCVVHLTPFYQEWIDIVSKNRKTPEWAYPLFAVGAGKMADITIRCLMLEWFNSNTWDRKMDGKDGDVHTVPLPSAQHMAHQISNMVIDIVAYQLAKKDFRDDWLKQSHYQKNWTVKRCRAFAGKMNCINKKQFTRKQREDFGHHMLRIAEMSNIIQVKNYRKRIGSRWYERVVVSFTDDILMELHNRHKDLISRATFLYRPMIVPPVPHAIDSSGGNLMPWIRKPVVQKFRDVFWDETVVQKNSTPSDIVIRGLNNLMTTEWTINKQVYEVMENMFHNNTRQANLPAYNFDAFDFGEPYPEGGAKEEKAKWCQRKEEAYSTWYKEERSRGRMLVRLQLAKDLLKWGFFYHVYTCDFRGRAYTACDLLSPQSSDFDRSLIMFAKPIKQTEQGKYWLKIHLANLFDQDKEPFADRIKWVDDNIELIQNTAKDPYEMRWFWVSDKKKKNPSFQRLAAIFELCRTDGLTQLPIQMDGSCNGVQHWAAIMRDTNLAYKVNLVKTETPQDLYGFVADSMTASMQNDIKDDNADPDTKVWADRFLDHWDNNIPRSVCKRAVMTDPYGVTFYGIRRYCKSEGHLDWVGKDRIAGAVMELATYIDKCLKNTLTNANFGKVWLKQISDIASNMGKNLEWYTPCGFKVVHQYYQILTRRSIAKLFNMKELNFGSTDATQIDDDQVNLAVSPNYIHSLDASHMWMTMNRMINAGISNFSFVHDSYGCAAPYVSMMRQFTKEEFYEMHKEPLLFKLKKDVEEVLGVELPEPPQIGEFDVSSVIDSEYFFH